MFDDSTEDVKPSFQSADATFVNQSQNYSQSQTQNDEEGEEEDAKFVVPAGKVRMKVVYMGSQITVLVKRTRPLQRVFEEAGNQFGFDPKTVRFTFDGVRLRDVDTPDSTNMEDDDEIDVLPEQVGGGRFTFRAA